MAVINSNYSNLSKSYLFSNIAKKVEQYSRENPDKKIISLGIGDVTMPISGVSAEAMSKAALELSKKDTFKGYGPEQGYPFLRTAIAGYYEKRGVSLEISEIFISDGAKSDLGNITDLFMPGRNRVLIPDPVYPVYVDTNVMSGQNITLLQSNEDNSFLPMPPSDEYDIIYLCSPNNPTGSCYTREQLKIWVDYAKKTQALLIFDSAYESYITDPLLPHSIYEIEGADECAIEFCSFSKNAGFTGVRCGYTIVPHKLFRETDGIKYNLNEMWLRRQTTKFNGVSYIVQRGAEACFSEEGLRSSARSVAYYLENAKLIAGFLSDKGIFFTGAMNSPYIWMKCPGNMKSWDFFDHLLKNCAVVGTPGEGFGKCGEAFFRLTGFGSRENTCEAIERMKRII